VGEVADKLQQLQGSSLPPYRPRLWKSWLRNCPRWRIDPISHRHGPLLQPLGEDALLRDLFKRNGTLDQVT